MAKTEVTLIARGEQADQPWIMRLCREFPIDVNIKKANVDDDYGWMLIEIEGTVEDVQRATAWLMTTGLHVEAKERALGA